VGTGKTIQLIIVRFAGLEVVVIIKLVVEIFVVSHHTFLD